MAVALLVAAGSGERLGADRPKAFVMLGGKPMVQWSVDALQAVPEVERIVVALPEGERAPEGTVGVRGGVSRSESVRAALAVSEGDPVVVHDAARPLAGSHLFERALAELRATEADGVVAAAPVGDTIKRAAADGLVEETLDRSALWAVQTPQAFRRAALERALDVEDDVLRSATDDAWLVERAGGRVRVVAGAVDNLKVTDETDLRIAQVLLRQRRHVAVVTEIIESVNQGRMEAPFVHYHADVIWDISAMQAMEGEFADVYRGHAGVRDYWRAWLSAWETVSFEAERLVPVGDHVVQFQRMRVRGRKSGIDLELPDYAQVWTFAGDKIVAMRLFGDREAAMRFAEGN